MSVVLVLTTVHPPDDPRVRTRTVGVLAGRFRVRYATQLPGPTDREDHEWVPLRGGRLRRHLDAIRSAWRSDVSLLSIHDPELIPLGLAVATLRRIPVVLDVHENVPAQIRTKEWLPRWSRAITAHAALLFLRVGERRFGITLAEGGYASLFRKQHPVLPNYPLVSEWPARVDSGHEIVYVGDVTEVRGAIFAVEAVAAMRTRGIPLRFIGRCEPALRERLLALAEERGVVVHLPGYLPHQDAMRAIAAAVVGLCPLADIPNYRHSLPTKMLEYLSVGVPVIASDLPGTAAILRGRAGVRLVAARDRAAWTEALEAVIGDPEMRARTQVAALSTREEFAWPAAQLIAVYTRFLASDTHRAPSASAAGDDGEPGT